MRTTGRDRLCCVLIILAVLGCGTREVGEGSGGEQTTTGTPATAGDTFGDASESTATTGDGLVEIDLADLQSWIRVGGPVLRDFDPRQNYEVASDVHVFRDEDGELRALYTGPNPTEDVSSIKLASATDHATWEPGQVLLSSAGSTTAQLNKETAFYRRADSGRHQIFYIGYADENVYQAQIFLAEADDLLGPYAPFDDPVVATGDQAGHDVFLMTSPSIVEHLGVLHMVYCAWDAFEDVTNVWVHAATSDDDGRTWSIVGEVDVPVCMEGSYTRGPDAKFYAVATADAGFTIGRADEPFGPYTVLPEPVMTPAGPPWEPDEMVAPQLFFEPGRAYLYYTAADVAVGWWTLVAFADLG